MGVTKFLVGIFATWRVTSMLVYDKWFDWLRLKVGVLITDDDDNPLTFWGRTLACFWCTSTLVSIPVALVTFPILTCLTGPLIPLAFSGAAILLNHQTRIMRDMENW